MAKVTLKDKKDAELQKDLFTHSEDLRKSRFNVAGNSGLKHGASSLRKEIARIKTELRRREMADK